MRRTVLLSSIIASAVSVIGTLVTMAVFGPAIADAQGTRVSSNEYVLVAGDGSVRARLVEAGGGARLTLTQGDAERVTLAYGIRAPEAAAIALSDLDNTPRVALRLAAGRERGTVGEFNGLSVFDKERLRASLGVDDATGSSFIELLDAAGNVVWRAP